MDGKMQDEKENKSNILETENPDEMFPPVTYLAFPTPYVIERFIFLTLT